MIKFSVTSKLFCVFRTKYGGRGRVGEEERAIRSKTGVSNRRLRIDLLAIKKAIEVGDVEKVVWIEGGEHVVDCLTKLGGNEKLLLEYMSVTKREKERRVRLMVN